jgi:FkbM family methyltransferase
VDGIHLATQSSIRAPVVAIGREFPHSAIQSLLRQSWNYAGLLPRPLGRRVANLLRRARGYPTIRRISDHGSVSVLHTLGAVWPRGYPDLLRTAADRRVGLRWIADVAIADEVKGLGTVRFPASAVLALSEFEGCPLSRVVQIGAGEGEEVSVIRSAQGIGRTELTLVEASPRSWQKIEMRLQVLKDPQVHLIRGAVGTAHGSVRLEEGDNFLETYVSEAASGPTVPSFPLAATLGRSQVDLLIMNIEGGELQVVPQLGDIVNRPRRVAVATHDFLADRPGGLSISDSVSSSLLSAGYAIWARAHATYEWERGWIFASLLDSEELPLPKT